MPSVQNCDEFQNSDGGHAYRHTPCQDLNNGYFNASSIKFGQRVLVLMLLVTKTVSPPIQLVLPGGGGFPN